MYLFPSPSTFVVIMSLHRLYLSFRDYLSPSDIIGSYPHLVITGTGLAFGFLVVRHRLSLSRSYDMNLVDWVGNFFSVTAIKWRFWCTIPSFPSRQHYVPWVGTILWHQWLTLVGVGARMQWILAFLKTKIEVFCFAG